MRTSKERARLIHRRTAEIKQERRIKETARDWMRPAWRPACFW